VGTRKWGGRIDYRGRRHGTEGGGRGAPDEESPLTKSQGLPKAAGSANPEKSRGQHARGQGEHSREERDGEEIGTPTTKEVITKKGGK